MTIMTGHEASPGYVPLSVADLGELMAGADESRRWRLVAEFLEDYRWEPTEARFELLEDEPTVLATNTGMSSWPHSLSTWRRGTGTQLLSGLTSARCANCGSLSTPRPLG